MPKQIVTNRKELARPTELVLTQEEVDLVVKDLDESFAPLRTKGFGLAANQIGINKAVAVLYVGTKKVVLINPKVIEKDGRVVFPESCFSFSGITVLTDRYTKIKILNGLTQQIEEYSGVEAIAIQHEIDHLCGLTIFDRKHKAR